jgi:hypothetical protein
VSLGEKKTNTVRQQDTLLHRETLLVVSSHNFDNVSLEFVTKSISLDFLRHALVVKDSELSLIIDFHHLLSTSNWIGQVELDEVNLVSKKQKDDVKEQQ